MIMHLQIFSSRMNLYIRKIYSNHSRFVVWHLWFSHCNIYVTFWIGGVQLRKHTFLAINWVSRRLSSTLLNRSTTFTSCHGVYDHLRLYMTLQNSFFLPTNTTQHKTPLGSTKCCLGKSIHEVMLCRVTQPCMLYTRLYMFFSLRLHRSFGPDTYIYSVVNMDHFKRMFTTI